MTVEMIQQSSSFAPAPIDSTTPTMTSQDIAALVESRHDNVRRTIERLAKSGVIELPQKEEVKNNQSLSPNNSTTVYVFSGARGKRDSIVVVAQLSPQFTARLVDRWQALEGKAPPSTFSQALRLAAEQQERIEQQQSALIAAAPKVEFVDRYASASGSQGFRHVCKLLGANEAQFRLFLLDQRIAYRLDGVLTPYQSHIDAGRFEVKTGVSVVSDHAFNQMRFTPKGVTWIAGEWGKQKLAQRHEEAQS